MILRAARELMARFDASRLSTKILVLSTLTIALPMLLLTGQFDRANSETFRRAALAALQDEARTQAAEMDAQFRDWGRTAIQASRDPAVRNYLAARAGGGDTGSGDARIVLQATLDSDPAFRAAYLVDASGLVVLSTDPGQLASEDPHAADVSHAARSGQPSISSLAVTPGTLKPVVTAGAPVAAGDGAFVGSIALRIDLSGLTQFQNPTRLAPDRFAMLVDEKGVVIGYTGPRPDRVLHHPDPTHLMSSTRSDGAGQVHFSITGRAAEVGYSTLQTRPWRAAVLQDEPAFLAPQQSTAVNTALFFVGAVFLVTIIVFIAIRFLERSETESLTDDLTELANRRYFQETMRRELARARRDSRTVSVIAIDLDHFKRINDEQGHQGGDVVLRRFARLLSDNVRTVDMAARHGGEEFTVLLPDTDKESALLVAEKLRVECERLRFDRRAGDSSDTATAQGLTLSAGVSTFPDDGDDEDILVRRADQAMYLSKSLGRNQVTAFGSPIPLAGLSGDRERVNLLIQNANRATVEALAAAVDARDSYTSGHSRRVAAYAAVIGIELGLDSDELEVLSLGALLHDVGKIGVADGILRKAGSLSEQEFARVRDHANIGYEMAHDVPFLEQVAPIILHHHENADGTGYPRGLAGEEIPLLARIVKVADAFDAMTSQRTYREASPVDWALAELRRNAGTQFDAAVVNALVAANAKRRVQSLVPQVTEPVAPFGEVGNRA